MYHPAASSIGQDVLAYADPRTLPVSYAEPPRRPIADWQAVAKRAFDIVVALLALAALTIPIILFALMIWLETPGWPFFRQCRIGMANVRFDIWKLRTMHEHASEPGRLAQATRHDKRVTRVGTFLRRYSFDELPQLINVLRGEMSLVGPRPHAPGTRAGGKPFEMVTPHYAARHRVRPGITGLAQIRGWRGETETEEMLLRRVESDLEYIDTWSLRRDIVILARTIVPVITARNAW
jgi:lipopolysaccharide/colanic/teichoic acid biosynthesis glycosyltransferase